MTTKLTGHLQLAEEFAINQQKHVDSIYKNYVIKFTFGCTTKMLKSEGKQIQYSMVHHLTFLVILCLIVSVGGIED